MKTIRIVALHLAYGGVEKAIINMANLFVEKYDVEIICVYNMPGSPAFPLDKRVKVRYLLKELPNREQWKAAVRSFDIPAFFKESLKSVRVLVGKKAAVKKAVSNIHDGILICTRHEHNLLLSAYGDKNILKIAQIHHDHKFEPRYVKAFKHRYNGIDVLAMLTPGLRDEVREIMLGCNDHTKVVAIPNFLESYPRPELSTERENTVLAVGRLDRVKGFDRLIRIFALVHKAEPAWKLRIVGEGSERGSIEREIAANDAKAYIELTGKLDAADVEREMSRASIYAMSSRSEGFPFVLLEAQSCSLPSVAFDVRVGPMAIIENGKNGYLIPDGEDEQFADKLIELIKSPELRRTMGEDARENSLRFSRRNVAVIWERVLEGMYER